MVIQIGNKDNFPIDQYDVIKSGIHYDTKNIDEYIEKEESFLYFVDREMNKKRMEDYIITIDKKG